MVEYMIYSIANTLGCSIQFIKENYNIQEIKVTYAILNDYNSQN